MLDVLEVSDPLRIDLVQPDVTNVIEIDGEPEFLLALREQGFDGVPAEIDERILALRNVPDRELRVKALLDALLEHIDLPFVRVNIRRTGLVDALGDEVVGQVV